VQGTKRDANGLSVARDSFGQVKGELVRNRFQPGDVQAGAAASATALSAQVDRTAADGRSSSGAGARLLNAEANYGVDYERRPGHLGVKAGGGIGADLASVEARGSRSFNLGRRELKVEGNAGAGIGIGANAGGEYLREKDRGAVGFNVGGAFGPGVDIGGRVSWQPIGG